MHRVKNLNEFKLDICTYLKLISRATLEKVNATHILVYFTRLKCIFWCPELWSHFTILDFIFCVFPKFTSILAPSFYVFSENCAHLHVNAARRDSKYKAWLVGHVAKGNHKHGESLQHEKSTLWHTFAHKQ